jgi:DNA invertase Pin-like site-specific DNA recombinase
MAEKPRRAAIYARISDDREGRELGVTRQVQDCQALAESLGWTLHPVRPIYKDNDKGASTLSRKPRPEYADLLTAVRAGQVDGILYWSNSRLTRRPSEYEDVITLVEETGVRLAAVKSTHVDLTTASGRMVGRVLAAVDAAESEQISERVQRRQQQHRQEGLPHSTGTRVFGFRPDGTTPEPGEADAIRDAAKMLLDGASLGDVVRYWTQGGVRPVAGGRWSRITVRRALTRPRVAGLIEHKGVEVGTFTDAPILDRVTWDAVRRAVSDRSSLVRARFRGREHLLSGFMTCGVCGSPMKIRARRDEAGQVRADSFVSCLKEHGGCGHVKRNLRLLEAFVFGAVEHRLAGVRPFAEDDPDDPEAQERARMVAERETVEHKIADLRRLHLTDPDFAAEDYVLMVNLLRQRARELDAALDALGEPARLAELADDPLETWRSGSFDDRRELLAAVVESVVLEPIGKVGPARARAMVPDTTKVLWRT